MGRRRLVITGASGFLGSMVALEASKAGMWDVTAVSLTRNVHSPDINSVVCDLSDPMEAERVIARENPTAVINCAALASVDGCESDRELATRLNAEAPAAIAAACSTIGAKMVHVSTDAVFGGTPPPYRADSEASPLNWYGATKLAGEHAVISASDIAAVVRTNIVGWSPAGTRSLLEFFANRLEAGSPAPGFDDVEFRPATTPQVARVLLALATSSTAGIIHATGDQLISKYQFGRLVADTLGFDPELVERTSISDSDLTAQRADCLDVLPSTDVAAVSENINLASGMAELGDLRDAGIRVRLRELVGTAA